VSGCNVLIGTVRGVPVIPQLHCIHGRQHSAVVAAIVGVVEPRNSNIRKTGHLKLSPVGLKGRLGHPLCRAIPVAGVMRTVERKQRDAWNR